MGGVDWDAAWQAIGTVAYGAGSKVMVSVICAYLFFHGMAHERLWQSACGVIGAIGYWGMGVFLGRIGIA
jgi:hypothetical protein